MDPSSSNSLEPGGTHRALEPKQVFLSHSGAQKEFVEVLSEEVLRSDRSAFFDIDQESLPIGVHFPQYIFDAIKQCKVGVLILSEEFFTRSKWPMLELAALYERRDEPNFRIIPVFLNITRDECRKKENHIRWFFEWCKWGVSKDELEKWKKAMEIFGPTNGLIYRDGTSKCDFRRDIVDAICQWVPSKSTWGISDVQGSEGIYKAIQGKFDATQVSQRYGVRVVGLYGMGGIGKTTACKVLCNKLFSDFCGRVCHVEFKESNDLEMLKEVVKRLTSTKQDVLENYNIDECCDRLESAMHKRKVFLAIDNVSGSMADLTKKLLKMRYGEGSIVLVTARTHDVLTSRVGIHDCMEMPDLVEEDAKSLFLQHSSPMKEVSEECLKKCIKQCYFGKGDGVKSHYHPLALRVLGSQFVNVDPMNWVEKLDDPDKFNVFGDKEHPIFSILRRNFDGLEFEDQMLFMDAAIFYPVNHDAIQFGMNGDREGTVVKSLYRKEDINIIGWLGMVHGQQVESIKKRLESLRKRSLIEDWGDGSRRIGMHDLWIEFAYAEAKGGESRKRAWLYEPMYGAADGRREDSRLCGGGWKQLERIYLKGSRGGGGFLKSLNLKRCQRLRVLKVVGIHIESGVLDLKTTKCLKSLEIAGLLERSATVKNICGLGSAKNLVVMRLSGIDLNSQFIDEVKGLTNLEFLQLPMYSGDCGLPSKLPELSQLSLLSNVMLCSDVESTISGLNSNLGHLRCLDLSGCGSLTSCPGVDALFALEELYLNGCYGLKELPNLQQLKCLQKLNIGKSSIEEVPGLGDLVALALVVFVAEGCKSLAVLPNMRKLSKLKILNIHDCDLIKADSGLCDLMALEEFSGPYEVLETSTDLQNLPKLVTIYVSGWSLHGPPGGSNFANLQDLWISSCKGVHELGGLLNFSQLQKLVLRDCKFQDVSCLSNLTTLRNILIYGCDELKRLPDMHKLTRLESLSVHKCLNLREWAAVSVHWFRTLPLLQTLEFWEVPIVELPDLSWFPQLKCLCIVACKRLERLISTEAMTALESVTITICESLKEVPDLSHSKLLRYFHLDYSDGVLLSAREIEKLKAMCPRLEFTWKHVSEHQREVKRARSDLT